MKLWPARPGHGSCGVSLAWLVFLLTVGLVSHAVGGSQSPIPSDDNYRYAKDDLGAVYHPEATTLKVWAPTARKVELALFPDAYSQKVVFRAMTNDGKGIWSVTLPGNQAGHYYRYQVTQPAGGVEPAKVWQVNDPYAHGTSANSGRTLIYDPAQTNPAGWEDDQFVMLRHNTDAILYEVQVRDFSVHPESGISHRGQFLGLAEPGTRTPQGEATGLDHLVELGITHVHLLPVNDYAGGDEREQAGQYTWYDWGYDPVLFASLEGSYASNPEGTARQGEFKTMVQTLHQHHIGVVLDVVFNHTAQTGDGPFSIFDKLYPGYYYRTDATGRYANATGCGNELASERPMARKFIVDTIKYWLMEYHVDGFRFDLMGILDRETMLEVYRSAQQINPSVIIYGEGWDMERVLPREQMMTQVNVQGTGIAAFNDGIRDNIKGDAGNASARGFVQGGGVPYGGMSRLWLTIKGQSTGRGGDSIPVASPNETINYDSVHDDLCLWDKIQSSATDQPEAARIQMDKLAAGMVLTSLGVPFLHAGDEFLRTKQLVSNSYNNNDPRVNPINWSLKSSQRDVFNYYQGLILLRKTHPAFRMTDAAAVDQAVEFATQAPKNLVAYVIKNHANHDEWKNILVIFNGSQQPVQLPVSGEWQVVANAQRAGITTLQTVKGLVPCEAFSLVIAHNEGDGRF